MGHDSVSLVLCCAEEGEVRLVDLIDSLHGEGHSPEVLSGIDADPDLLTNAVDRLAGPALFVLCQTPELGRAAVRRLSGLFSARRGPEHHVVTVDLATGKTLAALRDIRRSIDDVGVARPDVDDDADRFMRDVVGPTAMSAVGAHSIPEPSVDPEELARELAAGLDAAAAVLDRPRRRTHAPTPRERVYPGKGSLPALPGIVDDAEIDSSTEPLQAALERSTLNPAADVAAHRARTLAAKAASRATGIPTVVEDDRAMLGDRSAASTSAGLVLPPAAFDSPPPRYDSPPPRPSSDSGSGSVAAVADELERDAAIAVPVSSTHMARPRRLPIETGAHARPGGRLLLVLSAGGMVVLLGMAITQMAFDGENGAPAAGRGAPDRGIPAAAAAPDSPPRGPASGAPGRAAASDARSPAVDAEVPARARPEPSPSLVAHAESGMGVRLGDAARPAAHASGEGGRAEAAADDASPAPEPQPSATASLPSPGGTPPAPPQAEGVTARLQSAIADGKVEPVGKSLFVLTGRAGDTTTWDTADRRCRARKIDGVSGWRLPSRGQARALRTAGMLTTGTYWTRSVVGDDEAMAYDAATGAVHTWMMIEPNARTVCVRGR